MRRARPPGRAVRGFRASMQKITTRQGIYGPSVSRPEDEVRRSVAASVRNARARLTSAGPIRPGYRFELMQMFARNQLGVALGLPVMAAVVAVFMSTWLPVETAALWLASVLAAKAALFLLCRSFAGQAADRVNLGRWQYRFMAAEFLYGLAWSSLMLVCIVSGVTDTAPHVVAFVALIVMLSLRTMLAGSVAAIGYAGAVPITLTILFTFVAIGGPLFYALAGIAVGTQVYFVVVARRLAAATVEMMELRVQKDGLIADLEQAKSISDEARRRAEAANIAKSRFLATMSHELRTPLNAILGFSEVMKSEILGPHSVPTYREYSEDIHSSGKHLLNLIAEVLDLSRIEAGRYELVEEPVTLAYVVEDCLKLMELRARERGVTIEQHIEPDMPKLWADERAIRQVCLNLVSNSIKFTPNGGIITVKVGWTEAGGQYLSVKDTGPGIPEEEIPQILTSFGQGSLAQKTAEQGAGLGLPIVQGLVKLHGGAFELTSKLREGTLVTVALPPRRVLYGARPDNGGAQPGTGGPARPRTLETAA